MKKEGMLRDRRWMPALALALLLGVGLHDLFKIWPSILTEFISPVNESIWEHMKIIFWPLLLIEFGFNSKDHRASGLTAVLICCCGMLLAGWIYHVALGGTRLSVDLVIFVAAMAAYFLLRSVLPVPKSMLSILAGLYILVIGLILAFTITPPHGTLFNDPSLADAWVIMRC